MAVFDSAISTQVAMDMKQAIKAVLDQDKATAPSVSEGDVIREAVALGLVALEAMPATERIERYGVRRRPVQPTP